MEETKRCPYCGEEILAVAKKCKHCGEWLDKEEPKDKGNKKDHKIKGSTIGLIVTVIILIAAIAGLSLTCPEKRMHVNAINTELMQGISETIDSVAGENNGLLAMGLKVLGVNLTSNVSRQFVRNYVDYDDYFIFSITRGGGNLLSIGVLGHVFTTFTADDLKDKIKEYIDSSDSKEEE